MPARDLFSAKPRYYLLMACASDVIERSDENIPVAGMRVVPAPGDGRNAPTQLQTLRASVQRLQRRPDISTVTPHDARSPTDSIC